MGNSRLLLKSKVLTYSLVALSISFAFCIIFIISDFSYFIAVTVIVCCVVIFILALRLVKLEWKSSTEIKSIREKQDKLDQQISDVRTMLLRELKDQISNLVVSNSNPTPESSAEVAQKSMSDVNDNLIIGRLAAKVPDAEKRQADLFRSLNMHQQVGSKPELIGVMTDSLSKILSTEYHVMRLLPGTIREQISRSSSQMLLIDQNAFSAGAWYGATSASGTSMFRELSAAIIMAKDLDIPVWYIPTGAVSNPYSGELVKLVNCVLDPIKSDETWTENMNVHFINLIRSYVSGVK